MVFVLAVGIEQDLKGSFQVGVIIKRGDNTTFLIIVATYDFRTQQLFDILAVIKQVVILLGSEILLQHFDLWLYLIQIAFFFGCFLQLFNGLLTLSSIAELLVLHKLHEVLISSFVNLEAFGWCYALMLAVKLVGIIEDIVLSKEIGRHRGVRVTTDLHIGSDTMAFVDSTAAYSLECFTEGVFLHLGSVFLMRIVDLLDAASTRDVVVSHRDLHLGVVTQR